MKLLSIILVLIPIVAFANPFNQFEGNYEVSSEPMITNSDAAECERFAFDRLTEVRVRKGDYGFKNTHVVSVVRGVMWSTLPIAEYRRELGVMQPDSIISYAKTTGDDTSATNERGFITPSRYQKFIITMTKTDAGYSMQMTEKSKTDRQRSESSCVYDLDLNRI